MNSAGKADYDVKGAYWEPEIGHKISSGNTYTLVKGKDYTLSYKNIKAVADENSAKAPSVTIKFIGNYKGTKTIKYKIEASMYSTDYVMDVKDIYAKYTGKPIAVKPVVRFEGTTLKKGTDYDVVLAEDNNELAKASYTDVGAHKFQIKFKGNYTGLSNEFKFEITPQTTNLFGSFKVAKIPDQSYTGEEIKIDNMKLFSGKDPEGKSFSNKSIREITSFYKVEYFNTSPGGHIERDDCTEAGTVTAVITALGGGYTGNIEVTYKIVENDIKSAYLTKPIPDQEYTGYAPDLGSKIELAYKKNGETVKLGYGDYDISYDADYSKAGKTSVTVTGKGLYGGSKKLSFKITPYNVTEDSAGKVLVNNKTKGKEDISVEFSANGANPKPEIVFNSTTILKEGTDYTIKYVNNKKVASKDDAKAPTMNITFKKNLKGTRAVKYTITPKNIIDVSSVTIPDIVYNSKAGAWKQTKITVQDGNKKLKIANTKSSNDFSVNYYKEQACVNEFKDSDNKANTDVFVKITGNGNYTGSVVTKYHIAKSNISSATVDKISSLKYKGEGSKLTFTLKNISGEDVYVIRDGEGNEAKLTVRAKDGSILSPNKDYVIVDTSYKNNEKKGTASFAIQGKGDYCGTKTIKFTIIQQVFRWWRELLG